MKTAAELPDLASIASRINTGDGDPIIARALIVFNLTDETVSGVASMPAEIGWGVDESMPSITIRELGGDCVASDARLENRLPDPKGRPDRCRIAFDLAFNVAEIPAKGWKTYIAAYGSDAITAGLPLDAPLETIVVIETGFHEGDLPTIGQMCITNQSGS